MHMFKDYIASQDPGDDRKIMHAMLRASSGISFWDRQVVMQGQRAGLLVGGATRQLIIRRYGYN